MKLTQNPTFRFTFRAEIITDVIKWLQLVVASKSELPITEYQITSLGEAHGEVQVTYSTAEPRGHLEIMRQVEDGHVMIESLDYATNYTGERTYDDFSWLEVGSLEQRQQIGAEQLSWHCGGN